MKKPGGLRGFVGQPAVTLIAVGACLFLLYQWYLDGDAWFIGVAALVALIWIGKANSEVAAYRAWKQAWDAMAPQDARPGVWQAPWVRPAGAVVAVLLLGAFLITHRDDPDYAAALGWLLAMVALAALVGLARLGARSRRAARAAAPREPELVTVCVTKPLIGVPSLQAAYEALPEHCWRAINGKT